MGRPTFVRRTRLLPFCLLMAVSVLAGACGSRTAVPQPFPTARRIPREPVVAPPPGTSAPGRSTPAEVGAPALGVGVTAAGPVLQTAVSLIGVPYLNGGADPNGFDCSGFVAFVFRQHGVALPRTVESQASVGEDVDAPAAGDLVFFQTSGSGPSHVGIALGPDRFIHAPSSRGVVRIELLAAPYWAERFLEARRVLPPPADPANTVR
jgi:cell wall-associated NlpC family hydrolase